MKLWEWPGAHRLALLSPQFQRSPRSHGRAGSSEEAPFFMCQTSMAGNPTLGNSGLTGLTLWLCADVDLIWTVYVRRWYHTKCLPLHPFNNSCGGSDCRQFEVQELRQRASWCRMVAAPSCVFCHCLVRNETLWCVLISKTERI